MLNVSPLKFELFSKRLWIYYAFQIFYIALVVKSAVDIDAGKNFQAELTDLEADCATTSNSDTWWCKAVTSMLVDGDCTHYLL